MILEKLALQGKHNTTTNMAGAVAERVGEMRSNILRSSLNSMNSLEHRLEEVTSIRGVSFINDSKAININSVWYALKTISTPIIWIAGGVEQGNNYNSLKQLASKKVKMLICLGNDNTLIKEAFKDSVTDICECSSMELAVKTAQYYADSGDTVLLSPACASHDLFKNYEERGNAFKEQVNAL